MDKPMNTQEELAAMVERLKPWKILADGEDRLSGTKAGECFAKTRASYRMLQVIESLKDDYFSPAFFADENSTEWLVADLAAKLSYMYNEAWDKSDLGEQMFIFYGIKQSPVFLAAFMQAAANTWWQVRKQVEALVEE